MMAIEFFSGSMLTALWVFILKMNTSLEDPGGNLWVNFLSMEPFWKVPEEVKWQRVYYVTAILYITKPKINKKQKKKNN